MIGRVKVETVLNGAGGLEFLTIGRPPASFRYYLEASDMLAGQ